MSYNLYDASNQWANRPADQRFWTIAEMLEVCRGHRESAAEAQVEYRNLEVADDSGELKLLGSDHVASFTHWSFGQLCQRIKAPASYLRSLPAEVAAPVVNHGLQCRGSDGANLLVHDNGRLIARAFTSEQYDRIWNFEICDRLASLSADGWKTPPAYAIDRSDPNARPATKADLTRSTLIREGDMIGPAGLYASDHDMFAFLVNDDIRIADGTDDGISRGFMVWNSEVGSSALKLMKFGFRHTCGNHIIWGAKDVSEIRIVHRGNASTRYQRELVAELREYSNESTSLESAIIERSKRQIIGVDKTAVLDALFQRRVAPMKTLEASYALAERESDEAGNEFSPRSTWGMAQGLTRLSQQESFADSRVELDRTAGKVLQMTF